MQTTERLVFRCSSLVLIFTLLSTSLALGQESTSASDASTMDDPIAYAESAGIPEIAAEATILDADGNVLREGTNEWTCMAMPQAPMCVDPQWMELVSALMSGDETFEATEVGISYMLRGDAGASNTHPFATGPTPDNDWVVTGPHIMLISPDPAALAGIPTEPSGGGPYVMWSGTPFVQVMIPVEGGCGKHAGEWAVSRQKGCPYCDASDSQHRMPTQVPASHLKPPVLYQRGRGFFVKGTRYKWTYYPAMRNLSRLSGNGRSRCSPSA